MDVALSTMLKLRTPLPRFSLKDVVTGKEITRDDFDEHKALLIVFISNGCPYSQHIHSALALLGDEYTSKGVAVLAICPNDPAQSPLDDAKHLRTLAEQSGFHFPVCRDETQDFAIALAAACTPDVYIFDGEARLIYRGQFDSARPETKQNATGSDVRQVLDMMLEHGSGLVMTGYLTAGQRPATGCPIRWKKGNEPGYFRSALHKGA
jgi:peroxiredoxin